MPSYYSESEPHSAPQCDIRASASHFVAAGGVDALCRQGGGGQELRSGPSGRLLVSGDAVGGPPGTFCKTAPNPDCYDPAQCLPSGRSPVPVLSQEATRQRSHQRPRAAEVSRGWHDLGQHRGLLRGLQSRQRRKDAASGRNEAQEAADSTGGPAHKVHIEPGREDRRELARLPRVGQGATYRERLATPCTGVKHQKSAPQARNANACAASVRKLVAKLVWRSQLPKPAPRSSRRRRRGHPREVPMRRGPREIQCSHRPARRSNCRFAEPLLCSIDFRGKSSAPAILR